MLLAGPAAARADGPPPLDAAATEQILRWTFGAPVRPVKGPDPSTRKVHLGGDRPEEKTAVTATSLLPEPGDDGDRLLLIRDGALQRLRFGARQLTPLPLPAGAPPLTRLVALSADGRVLYALGRRGGEDERLLRLELAGDAVRSCAPAAARAELLDEQRFLSEHHLGRCQKGGARCLVVQEAQGVSALQVVPQRGQAPRPLQAARRISITDVAWADPRGQAVYVLARDR